MGELGAHESSGALMRWLQQPPRWVFHLALLLPLGCLMWSHSVPGRWYVLSMLGAGLLVLFGCGWLPRAVGWVLDGRRSHPRLGWWLLVAPVMVLGTIAIDVAGVPLQVRWATSESDFDAVVDELDAHPADEIVARVPDSLGSYEVRDIWLVDDGVYFFVPSTGLLTGGQGFAHLPAGPEGYQPGLDSPTYDALGGDWYAFSSRF